jgi:hypothetical protein
MDSAASGAAAVADRTPFPAGTDRGRIDGRPSITRAGWGAPLPGGVGWKGCQTRKGRT